MGHDLFLSAGRRAGRNITGLVGFRSLVLAIPSFATLVTFKQRYELGFSFGQIGSCASCSAFSPAGNVRFPLHVPPTVAALDADGRPDHLFGQQHFFCNRMPAAFCIEAVNGLMITLIQSASRSGGPFHAQGQRGIGLWAEHGGLEQRAAIRPLVPGLPSTSTSTSPWAVWINVIVAMALVTLMPLVPRSIMSRREGEH